MKTMDLDSKREVTFSVFKERTRDVFELKVRVMNKDTLNKAGIILEIPIESLSVLSEVKPGEEYPRFVFKD